MSSETFLKKRILSNKTPIKIRIILIAGNLVEWLKRRDCDRHDLSSKPTRVILFCFWKRHFPLIGGLGKQF